MTMKRGVGNIKIERQPVRKGDLPFFFNLRVFIKVQPQREEQETFRSKDTQFAGVELSKCLEGPHVCTSNVPSQHLCVYSGVIFVYLDIYQKY